MMRAHATQFSIRCDAVAATSVAGLTGRDRRRDGSREAQIRRRRYDVSHIGDGLFGGEVRAFCSPFMEQVSSSFLTSGVPCLWPSTAVNRTIRCTSSRTIRIRVIQLANPVPVSRFHAPARAALTLASAGALLLRQTFWPGAADWATGASALAGTAWVFGLTALQPSDAASVTLGAAVEPSDV